jgi:hypothetical protein
MFAGGEAQKDLVLRVRDDVTPELEETFLVVLKTVSKVKSNQIVEE